MIIGLEVWGADLAEVEATCRRAEAAGIDAFYYGESPGPLNLDCFTVLAHLAARTSRIRLGPVIANVLPGYRSALLLARQAATLAVATGGRFDLRTGVGAARSFGRAWWEPWGVPYGPYADRLADLDAALTELHRLWSPSPPPSPTPSPPPSPTPSPTPTPSPPPPPSPTPTPSPSPSPAPSPTPTPTPDPTAPGAVVGLGFAHPAIPVTVAATGSRAVELAHRQARVWELSFRTPAELAEVLANHRCPVDGDDGGRCPLSVSLEIDGFLAPSEAAYQRLLSRVRADRAHEDLEPVLARALRGTPEAVADQIRALAAAGADQLVVALHDPHDAEALDALARAVRLVDHP